MPPLTSSAPDTGRRVFVESWGQGYGTPYAVPDDEDETAVGTLVEDEHLIARPGRDRCSRHVLEFVDGRRRAQASLYQVVDGRFVRGIAGAFACGSVRIDHEGVPNLGTPLVERLLIWNGGAVESLPTARGGWSWKTISVASDDPAAPLAELQARMRVAEAQIAQSLSCEGALVVADGPLTHALQSLEGVVGYIKTHRRALLPAEEHSRIATLPAQMRSSLFAIGENRYSCYLRLSDDPEAGPWGGIVRLEFAGGAGLERAVELADTLTIRLIRFAGVRHRDPRAPQNLQPIGALENYLGRFFGPDALAERAVREAVRTRTRDEAAGRAVLQALAV